MADGFNYGYQQTSKAQNAAKPATSPFTSLFNGLLGRNTSKNNQAASSPSSVNTQNVPQPQVPYEGAQYSHTMPPAYALPPPVYAAPAYHSVNPYATITTPAPVVQPPLKAAAPTRAAPKLGGIFDGIFKGNIMENWWVFVALFFILFPSAGKGFLGPK